MSPSAEVFKTKRRTFTPLLNGYFGYGKTRQLMTFPKVYALGFDPSGLDILYQKGNEKLLANLVWYEYIGNKSEADLQILFKEDRKIGSGSIYGFLAQVEDMAKKGEIETIGLDGFTYLVDMKWQHICEFEEQKSANTGNVDTQAMYRNLGLWLQRFYMGEILTLASRFNLNVVTTCHLKRESPDAVQGNQKTTNRARKVAMDSDIAPQIEGGFRNKIEGLVGASIYLDKKISSEGKLRYLAYCDKTTAWGTVVNGKNRYGLPAVLDISERGLYETLVASVSKQSESTNGSAVNKEG